MLEIVLYDRRVLWIENDANISQIRSIVSSSTQAHDGGFYLLQNGKRLCDNDISPNSKIYVAPRLLGGKGGFGSMLRAIGAQIEKTTNREACRDLSGRRLRDINEEKRLKNWIAQQTEREKEAADRKQRKLERLVQKPKHEFKDETYDKERSELPDKVEDAVAQGIQASASCRSTLKRRGPEVTKGKKKPKLWVDADVDLSSTDDEGGSDDDRVSNKPAPVVPEIQEVSVEDETTTVDRTEDSDVREEMPDGRSTNKQNLSVNVT